MRGTTASGWGPGSQWLTAVACLALSAASLAQRQPGGVALREFGGELSLESEWRDERRVSSSGNRLDRSEWLLRELAGIRLKGDIYHPAFIDLDAAIKARFTQRDIEDVRRGQSGTLDEQDLEYGIGGKLFKDLPNGLSVYARRNRLETRARFFETSSADIETWGADARLGSLWIPSTLHYGQYSYVGRGADRRREDREELRVNGSAESELYVVRYEVERTDVDQIVPDRSYRQTLGRGEWRQRFVAKGDDYVSLFGTLRRQEGDLESDTKDGRATLHLQWSDSLSTDHGIEVGEATIGSGVGGQSDRIEYFSTLRHRLYESLDSYLTGRLSEADVGLARIDRQQLEARFDYKKNTSFGSLALNYRPRWQSQDERSNGEPVPVVDESHPVTLGVPILLSNPRVVASSIVVTNLAQSVVYVEPLDYVVTLQGEQVRLDIPVGSMILAGDTILVSYLFTLATERRFRSVSQGIGLGLNFGRWASLYFGYDDERQDLLAGMSESRLGNSRIKTVRGDIHGETFTFGAEYEDRDLAFAPYERTEFHARKTLDLARGQRIQGRAEIYRTRFRGQPEAESGKRVTGTYNWRIDNTSSIHGRAAYHNVDYRSDSGSGWLLEAGFDYRVRNLELKFNIRYSEEDFDVAADENLLYAHISLRRLF